MDNKHGLKLRDEAERKTTNNRWVKFTVNETYLPLIAEFPEDYRIIHTEIKLDLRTLPQDGQWCECENGTHCKIVSQYISEEEAFFPVNDDPSLLISAFDMSFWRPLIIEWEWKEWSEQKERLASLIGHDNFNNDYTATGVIGVDLTDILEVSEIEYIGANSKVLVN